MSLQEQPKQEMTSLDIRIMARELRKALTGGKVRKIYQYGRAGSRKFLFEVYMPQKGAEWLYFDNSKIFMTRRKKAAPQEPPTFCMFLRKHLMSSKIKSIRQHEFDRIVEIIFDESILIIEMFSAGNVILCDTMYNIIMPLEFQKWKGREVKPKVPYKYPPRLSNPYAMEFDSFRRSLAGSERIAAAHLAVQMGFGAQYANELCARAGVDPAKPGQQLSLEEASGIFKAIREMDEGQVLPSVYQGAVSPFPLRTMANEKPKGAGSLSEAFDDFFSEQQIETARDEAVQGAAQERERVDRILTQQDQAREKWLRIANESTEKGNRIYGSYPAVEAALNGVAKARSSGMSWDEIKEAVRGEQTPEAESIKEIRQGDGIMVLDLGGMDVEVEVNKSVEANAARYYEDAKWAKKKLEGAGQAQEQFTEKREQAQAQEDRVLGEDFKSMLFPREKKPAEDAGEPSQQENSETEKADSEEAIQELERIAVQAQEPRPEKKRWYEKFRWFFSSDGFLVVAGRSADQNELLLKRHTDPNDIVFHADIQGAAFVVIKAQGLEVPETTKREAAEFSAANSKAWSRGLGTVDIFSVPRDRVSKSPPSGQYLPKGSFMIHGEREWYRNLELKVSLGVKLDREAGKARVLAGPVMPIRKASNYFVTLKPGFKKSMELSRTIKNKLLAKAMPEDRFLLEKLQLDEIQVAAPPGMADVVEHAGEAV